MGTDGKFPFFQNHQSVSAQRDSSDKYQNTSRLFPWFRERAHRALEIAARFPQAPTALSSGDDFKNGQKTPCLRTARTYAILTAPAAAWFSNGR